MHLFISYARVDRPYCVKIVDMLDVHEVWYDHRIHAGQDWWEEIQKQIAHSEGFVYLISPESASSIYCQQELDIAIEAGKHVFPVLIHPEADMPEKLQHIHFADLSKGLTPAGVKQLLNAIYIAERRDMNGKGSSAPASATNSAGKTVRQNGGTATATAVATAVKVPSVDPAKLVTTVGEAMEAGDYDKAVYLLKQAKEDGCETRFINIEAMLQEAERILERQTYLREAEREYKPIVSLVKQPKMRKLGCRAFQEFRQQFPDYDPENLASICSVTLLPNLEWCDIPQGEVTIEYDHKHVTYFIDSFRISKYPVTNAQFQTFIDDSEGYADGRWWEFSPQAKAWHRSHAKPMAPKFSWGDHPRANVNWYEAMAFCKWLSHKTGLTITLPKEQQWQRAAQGDDGRVYPWGEKFDKAHCNSRESGLRMTSAIGRYRKGASPYGVHGMAGNVWEWCDSKDYNQRMKPDDAENVHIPRAVRGGSFISVAQRVRATFHFYLNPLYRYATIGFRVATSAEKKTG